MSRPDEVVKVGGGLDFPEGPSYDGKGHVAVSNCHLDYVTQFGAAGTARLPANRPLRCARVSCAELRRVFERLRVLLRAEVRQRLACVPRRLRSTGEPQWAAATDSAFGWLHRSGER